MNIQNLLNNIHNSILICMCYTTAMISSRKGGEQENQGVTLLTNYNSHDSNQQPYDMGPEDQSPFLRISLLI